MKTSRDPIYLRKKIKNKSRTRRTSRTVNLSKKNKTQ
jgi:hypothetical protein